VNAPGPSRRRRATAGALALALGCAVAAACGNPQPGKEAAVERELIPIPVSVSAPDGAVPFEVTSATRIVTPAGSPEAARIGEYLAALLRRPTGFELPVGAGGGAGGIELRLGADGRLGAEGYELDVRAGGVTLLATRPEGLFRGVQTLRQLLPAVVEGAAVRPGIAWRVPAGRIVDHPRFAWRGAMLDVARHFFPVADVKRYLDLMALYKLNVLHLHLTDDQGWRIAIEGWPRLTAHGGSTAVGGGAGGFYTRRDYEEIVRYARERYVTVVPEIDMPGHTNAALASYAELNCDGTAPDLYTGIGVGRSSLCVDAEETYAFVDDVLGQLAALTPGPYLHAGGDEARTLSHADYVRFVERVQRIVQGHGKRMVGWQEIAGAELPPGTVAQYWDVRAGTGELRSAAGRGVRLVLSPADKTYLDMKYDAGTDLGLDWAGTVEVDDAYDWEPATLIEGVDEAAVLGVEAPLWTETLTTFDDVQVMALPRLPGVAEVGWSPAARRGWDGYRHRLAAQAPRWSALGLRYHRSPAVPWPG
jgi:hexosaminidase